MKHLFLATMVLISFHANAAIISAADDGLLVLYQSDTFAMLQSCVPCKDCQADLQKTKPQALWYFKQLNHHKDLLIALNCFIN